MPATDAGLRDDRARLDAARAFWERQQDIAENIGYLLLFVIVPCGATEHVPSLLIMGGLLLIAFAYLYGASQMARRLKGTRR